MNFITKWLNRREEQVVNRVMREITENKIAAEKAERDEKAAFKRSQEDYKERVEAMTSRVCCHSTIKGKRCHENCAFFVAGMAKVISTDRGPIVATRWPDCRKMATVVVAPSHNVYPIPF
jgi:hypothetical protein